jgi:long-chain fatty acid transport protein
MFKKTLLLSLAASSLLATNGVNLIGTSTVSRSMGGTGVAFYSHATEAMHKNVALIGDVEQDEFQIDMTYFNANLSSSVVDGNPISTAGNGTSTSQNMLDTNFIPSMSYVTRSDEDTVFGIAMIGAAGMAANYEGDYPQRQLRPSMMLMKIIPAVSYRQGNVTFGIAPVLGLGSMSLNYDEAYRDENGNVYPTGTKPQSDRSGLFGTNIGGEDLVPALGFTLGIDIQVTEKLRIGASYNSSLKYTYSDVANFSQFGPDGMVYMADEFLGGGLNPDESIQDGSLRDDLAAKLGDATADALMALMPDGLIGDSLAATDPANLDDLTLEQPWELAVGFSYELTKKMSITADYRYIDWESTEGYGEFGWKSQHVFAVGTEYKAKNYSLRFGYNYANSPIEDATGEFGSLLTNVQGHYIFDQALSMLNLVGFPAISTTHFSAGIGYKFSKDMDLDFAIVYSPESTSTRGGTLLPLDFIASGLSAFDYEYETKMQQLSLSGGINYRF